MSNRQESMPRLKAVPVAEWPEIDQRRWNAAFTFSDSLLSDGEAVSWATATRTQVARTWGLYLAYLVQIGALDPAQPPSARVTPKLFHGFIANRKAVGNANTTIAERCFEVRMALRAMEPETAASHAWIVKPGGRSIATWLPGQPAPKPIIDTAVLSTWALDVIASAKSAVTPLEEAETLRDGLILAILAERAPRSRSMAAMALAANVHVHQDCIRIAFRTDDMKERNTLSYDVPAHLVPAFTRYLQACRPRLLGCFDHKMVWVERDGMPMTAERLQRMVVRRSKARFGHAIGPHRARHALATTALNMMPENPGIAAAVLGNSHRVVENHYAQADQLLAGRKHLNAIAASREETREMAAEAFARR